MTNGTVRRLPAASEHVKKFVGRVELFLYEFEYCSQFKISFTQLEEDCMIVSFKAVIGRLPPG